MGVANNTHHKGPKQRAGGPRAGGSKVKTGCANCKNRHVKCDETKPQCKNCVKKKIICPGYPAGRRSPTLGPVSIVPRPATNLQPAPTVAPRTASRIVPVAPSRVAKPPTTATRLTARAPTARAPATQITTTLVRQTQRESPATPPQDPPQRVEFLNIYEPSLSLPGDEQEQRCFRLFRERTVGELSGFFESNFWTRCVLQESHSKSSIRHAVVAIGSLYKTMESSRPGDMSAAAPHHEFALRHFGYAIAHLKDSLSNCETWSLRTALIMQVLFICFESFHGDHQSAINQVQAGMMLLDDQKRQDEGDPSSPEEDDGVENELVHMFTRLAVQAKSYDMAFHRNMSLDVQLTGLEDYLRSHAPLPAFFTDMLEARRIWEDLCMQSLRFTSTWVPQWLMRRPLTETFHAEFEELERQLDTWSAAFEPLYQFALTAPGHASFVGAAVLRTYQNNAMILWQMAFEMDECKFDQYRKRFEENITLSRRVMALHNSSSVTPSGASFSFDQALIPALYVTATKCRDRKLRRQAVGLLLQDHRREGMWDSVLAGKVAQWVMEQEEYGFGPDDFIPDSSRITITKITFDLRSRNATVWAGTRYSPVNPQDPKYRTTEITW